MGRNVGKKIITILQISVISIFIFVAFCTIAYRKTGKGIGIASYSEYKTVVTSFGGSLSTYIMAGEMPEPDDVIDIKHRNNSKYDLLTEDEKIVYDAVLSRSIEIINGETNNTEMHIPINAMDISVEDKTYEEIKSEINERIRSIDYKKVFKSLHRDFEYLMWWEYDMNWEYSEADINIKNNDLSESSFKLVVSPATCFRDDNSNIKEFYVNKAHNAYEYAKYIANDLIGENDEKTLLNIKNWIIENLDYDDSVVELMYNGVDSENVVLSRNYINAFDENFETGAICGGYTNAFQLLCDLTLENANCLKEEGKMVSDTKTMDHAWNIILYNEKSYLADITNSDEGTVGQRGQLFMKAIYRDGDYDIVMPSGSVYSYYED